MATAETANVATADERAWELFFDALDADSESAARIPPGAAILAADAANREDLVHRYHADGRSVVLVHEDGRTEILRPSQLEKRLIVGGLILLVVWLALRGPQRVPA